MNNLSHLIKNCDQIQIDIIGPAGSGKQAIVDLLEKPLNDSGFNIKFKYDTICGITKETLIITKKL